ncbi:hypothetical protein [Bacillus sp. 165]|uniref:hypothetical protein n=1 Tax=Bacillus sp. 165 TaxID=1529117 RepID=UPI001ADC7AA3|nr:hypothetical protein [Bacillus sp. 165]
MEKLNQYQRDRIKEYVLIYPNLKIMEQSILEENSMYRMPYIQWRGCITFSRFSRILTIYE